MAFRLNRLGLWNPEELPENWTHVDLVAADLLTELFDTLKHVVEWRLTDIEEGLAQQQRVLIIFTELTDLVEVVLEVTLNLLLEDLELSITLPDLVNFLPVQSQHLDLEVVSVVFLGNIIADHQFVGT